MPPLSAGAWGCQGREEECRSAPVSLEVPAQGQSVQALTLAEGIKSSWGPRVLR